MPTGDRGGAQTKRLSSKQKVALKRAVAKMRATPATSEHSDGQSKPDNRPRTTNPQGSYAATMGREQKPSTNIVGRSPEDQKTLERISAKKHKTIADVAADVAKGTVKTTAALTLPLARDIKNTPKSIVQNSKVVVTGNEKYKPKPMESGVFYPKLAEEFAKSLAKDVTDPRHHKLNLALDAAAFASGGASAAGKLVKAQRALKAGEGARGVKAALKARALPQEVLPRKLVGDKETGTRRVTLPEGGSVQPAHQSRSIPTAAVQHAFDRASEKVPGLPVVGAKARAVRIIPEQQMLRDRRAAAQVADLSHAAKKIQGKFGGTSAKEAAYTAIKDYGHGPEGVKLLDADVARLERSVAKLPKKIEKARAKVATLEGDARKAQARKVGALESNLRTETARIKAWQAAREYVADPFAHQDLSHTLALGEAASREATASRIARKKITAETAEASVHRNARIASGARYERVGARKARAEQIREYPPRSRTITRERTKAEAETRLAQIDATYEDVLAKIAGGYEAKSAKGITAYRNSKAGIRKRKGLAPLQTVKGEARKLAETQLTKLLEKNAHPTMQRLNTMLDEAALLRESLDAHALEGKAAFGSVSETIPGKPRRVHLREVVAQRRGGTLVGAEDVKAGSGAFYGPDVEKRGRKTVRTRSVNRAKDKAHQSTGTLASTGRNRLGPQVTVEDYLKETRFKNQNEDAKLAESFSQPFDPEKFDPAKHELLNPQGGNVPRYLRSEQAPLALEQSTPVEIAKHHLDNRLEWAHHVFPPALEDVPKDHLLGLRMVDKKIAEAITGRDRYYAMTTSGKLGKLLDLTNNLNRAALIYLNPSYIPKNFAGNLGFLGLQQGPWAASNLLRSTHTLGKLSPETLRWISGEAGGGAVRELAAQSRGPLSTGLQRVADVQGAGADRLPRIAAWLWEAERRGYKTEEQILKLRHDAKLQPVLNEISEGANQAMVKFSRSPTQTRRVVSRAIFIAPWVEGATRYVGRLALDRPLAARGAQEVRQRVQDVQKKVFGEGTRIVGSRFPIGKTHTKFGNKVVRAVNLMSLSSTGQAAEVGQALNNARTGNWKGSARLGGFIQPAVVAAIEASTGIDTYHGRFYPHGTGAGHILKENFVGSTDHPAIPVLEDVATAFRKPQTEPYTGPKTGQDNYAREGGLRDALWKLGLGSARPIEVNLDAVKAKGEKAKLSDLPPVKRSVQTVFNRRETFYKEAKRLGMLGKDGKLGPMTRKAFNTEAERQALYARESNGLREGTIEYQQARALADLKFLSKRGIKTTATPASLKKATDVEALKKWRAWVSRTYYQREGSFLHTINLAKRALDHAGAHGLD